MKLAIALVFLVSALSKFGRAEEYSKAEIQSIVGLSDQYLANIPLPSRTNIVKTFNPLYFLGPLGNIITLPATVSLIDGVVHKLDIVPVGVNDIVFATNDPEKFTLTLQMNVVDHEFQRYVFNSIISNEGHLYGKVIQLVLVIPIDTSDGNMVIDGDVGCTFGGQNLKFRNGISAVHDAIFNILRSLFYGLAETIIIEEYIPYVAQAIIDAFNKVIVGGGFGA